MYDILRKFGVSKNFLYYKLGMYPIRMNFIPERRIIEFINQTSGKILQVKRGNDAGRDIRSRTYFVTK